MKLAVVTPMSARNPIADVTMQAVECLAADAEVDVWSFGTTPDPVDCAVPWFERSGPDLEVQHELAAYDVAVWVLGNSAWHQDILTLARRLPGLVVLHDVTMTGLARRVAAAEGSLDDLVGEVERRHGTETAATFRTGGRGLGAREWLQVCAQIDLNPFLLRGSLGAMVHSRWHAGLVSGHTLGDVTVARLPVPRGRVDDPAGDRDPAVTELLDRLPGSAGLLVTLGHVNANRRVELLLEAVAAEPALRESMSVWAVGPVEPESLDALQAHANRLGLAGRFTATGRVADADLDRILTRATAAAALRDPVLEGQSASVLTQMCAGVPVLVLDHAHYRELPDDAVVKIGTGPGARDELSGALLALLENPSRRAEIGAAARAYAGTSRGGQDYARDLLAAAHRAQATRPLVRASQDIGKALDGLGLRRPGTVRDAAVGIAADLLHLDRSTVHLPLDLSPQEERPRGSSTPSAT